jgi:hypothetical protein
MYQHISVKVHDIECQRFWRRDIRSSAMLRSTDWYLVTVSLELLEPWKMKPICCPETSVTIYDA